MKFMKVFVLSLAASTAVATAQDLNESVAGKWIVTSAKFSTKNITEFRTSDLEAQKGKIFEFAGAAKVNGSPRCVEKYKLEKEEDPRASDFEPYFGPIIKSCKSRNGLVINESQFPTHSTSLICNEREEDFPSALLRIDDETMVAPVDGVYNLCLKRTDVNLVKLSSSKPYNGSTAVEGQHEFAFDFSFRIPAQLSASQGNAGRSRVALAFRGLGAKATVTCSYKGDAVKAAKNKPVPVSNRFAFVKCSNGALAGDAASGAVFTLSVAGGPQLAGADRTTVDLTLAREGQ